MSIWFRNDKRLPQGRLAIVSYVIVGMIGVLLLGFWKLQVIDSDKLWRDGRAQPRAFHSHHRPARPHAGPRWPRPGRQLSQLSAFCCCVTIRPSSKKIFPLIADGLGISVDDLHEQLNNTRALPKFQPIVIKPEATKADVAFIESHRADIPLLEMLMVHRRRYLPDGFMGHASGYVGEVSERRSKPAMANSVRATWPEKPASNASTTTN